MENRRYQLVVRQHQYSVFWTRTEAILGIVNPYIYIHCD